MEVRPHRIIKRKVTKKIRYQKNLVKKPRKIEKETQRIGEGRENVEKIAKRETKKRRERNDWSKKNHREQSTEIGK